MSAPARNLSERDENALQAYHDGELSGLARWRFERRLRRSPALLRELETLSLVGELVRESEPPVPTPDLWDAIAQRLPGIDGARGREAAGAARSQWWKSLLQPLPIAAAAAVAALVLALAIGLPRGDTATGGVVQFVNSGGRDVVVLEGDADMTVIWVLDGGPEDRTGGSRGTA